MQDEVYYINVDAYQILYLLDDWDAEDCMYASTEFHMKEFYALKYQINDPNTPTHMELLSSKHQHEH